eukprot:1156869-Pelagomonas_calceolata.AAC.2
MSLRLFWATSPCPACPISPAPSPPAAAAAPLQEYQEQQQQQHVPTPVHASTVPASAEGGQHQETAAPDIVKNSCKQLQHWWSAMEPGYLQSCLLYPTERHQIA